MKRMIVGFAMALALSTGAAIADGMDKRMAAGCCAAPSWTGFYLGAGVGAGAVVHEINDGSETEDAGGEGFFGTVIVGYDRQIDARWVAGVFADFDFSNISTDAGDAGSVDHKHSWAVGARLGVLLNPTTLWYSTVGYTEAKFDADFGSLPTFKGIFLGTGLETQLHGGWALRGEYRFTHFDEETVPGYFDIEPTMHTARLVLTYKLHRDEVRAPLK